MFELFDQFLYISIMMFGAYITLYIKNRSYAGILLIACSILSNIMLFAIVLDPFVFITLPITAVLLLRDFAEDFKSGIVSRKHKIGALIAAMIITYDFFFVLKISNLQVVDSISLFMIGSVIGTITGFYLVIYPFKEMMAERRINLDYIERGLDPRQMIENQQSKILVENSNVMTGSEQHSISDGEQHSISDEEQSTSSKPNSIPKIWGIDSLYFLVGGIVLVMLGGSIIYNFATRTVLDMQDYVFVTVEPDAITDAEVGYYASFEHFDKNNFYDQLIADGQEYGLSPDQIEKYTPVYTSENEQMFKKLDIKVANNKATVNNGDVVTTNITYDENYALKNNIVVKNTNFETEINSLPTGITDPKTIDEDKLIELSIAAIKDSKYGSKYSLDTLVDSRWVTDDQYAEYILTFGNQDPGLLGLKGDTVSFKVTPYTKNGSLAVADEVAIYE